MRYRGDRLNSLREIYPGLDGDVQVGLGNKREEPHREPYMRMHESPPGGEPGRWRVNTEREGRRLSLHYDPPPRP